MIIGIGVDVVDITRFGKALARTPALRDRLFTETELVGSDGRPRSEQSLAARFAAKEAVAKALGAPPGLEWHDCVVVTASDGRPLLAVGGTVKKAAARAGVRRWHLSLSHDGSTAMASVIAEGA